LSHFDPSFIGLTGKSNNDPELREAMRNFKIYASKIKYEMDEEEVKYFILKSERKPRKQKKKKLRNNRKKIYIQLIIQLSPI
jgi:hypothetical protein